MAAAKLPDLERISGRSLARFIANGTISSVEATQEALKRLDAAHELTHCTITREPDEALAGAKVVDAALARGQRLGPLAGVPLAHKDMFDRTGKIASWGAKIRAAKPATSDATVIDRFKAAGALQIAALHLTEFAFGPTGHNYVLGHARNPWDPTRITGGSSAGTACAVAYGAIPAGLGQGVALREKNLLPLDEAHFEQARTVLDETMKRVEAHYKDDLAPAIERVWDDAMAQIKADAAEALRRLLADAEWTPTSFELSFGLLFVPKLFTNSCLFFFCQL